MDITLSIIIPVGDASRLEACRRSIDASVAAYEGEVRPEIIAVMDETHRGVDWARNEGLRRATGDWIAWVDCDDDVAPSWFSALADALQTRPDVVALDAVTSDGRSLAYRREAGMIPSDLFVADILREVRGGAQCWRMCVRKELYNGLSFKGRVYEDYGLFLEMCGRIRMVQHLAGPLYRYQIHADSLARLNENGPAAGARLLELLPMVESVPASKWQAAQSGWALRASDWLLHAACRDGKKSIRKALRKRILSLFRDAEIPLKLKVKALVASI